MIKHVESAQLPKQQVMQNTWPARQVFWHVLLLGSLVFSQPLFKTLGSQPEFLLAHNLDGLKLVWWICMVGFLPGLVVASVVFTLISCLSTPRYLNKPFFGNRLPSS